jgi:hypothetical protein
VDFCGERLEHRLPKGAAKGSASCVAGMKGTEVRRHEDRCSHRPFRTGKEIGHERRTFDEIS